VISSRQTGAVNTNRWIEHDIDLFNEPDLYDVNIIGSMFKAWLRELPDEILPKAAQARIADASIGATSAPQILRDELSMLPPFNYYLLFAVTCHLSLLHSFSDKNKMDYRNLCICFQPALRIDAHCFQFLVCDWKNCWQGCWTEKQALRDEYRFLDGKEPELTILDEEEAAAAAAAAAAAGLSDESADESASHDLPPPSPIKNGDVVTPLVQKRASIIANNPHPANHRISQDLDGVHQHQILTNAHVQAPAHGLAPPPLPPKHEDDASSSKSKNSQHSQTQPSQTPSQQPLSLQTQSQASTQAQAQQQEEQTSPVHLDTPEVSVTKTTGQLDKLHLRPVSPMSPIMPF
jgi:hypothetical protein